ncbi:glycoside hydrolase family protein [Arcobacter ellisii]|uniref:Lysozyme n=1 Tax=Arcobacter ellisii TaxID=913109 RepID=A0A347U8J0_9BACT|nr:lysozyme [Arcobacter ellisii]AXX95168.1 putative phage-related lysozyme [Arcobacter ellisii]RXI30178.1 lysozyme [Arcobacter ellisii]
MNYEELEKSIKKSENISLKPYLCPKGHITIGWGRNLRLNGISKSEADLMLKNDILNIKLELEDKLPIFKKLDDIRQNVLLEMAFNMGVPKLLGFKNTIAFLKKNDFESASKEMLNSKWHREFIEYDMKDNKRGNSGLLRSEYLSKVMREGKY